MVQSNGQAISGLAVSALSDGIAAPTWWIGVDVDLERVVPELTGRISLGERTQKLFSTCMSRFQALRNGTWSTYRLGHPTQLDIRTRIGRLGQRLRVPSARNEISTAKMFHL